MRTAGQAPADPFSQLPGDTQTEAGPLLVGGQRGVDTVELVENHFPLVGRNSRTAVANTQNQRNPNAEPPKFRDSVR